MSPLESNLRYICDALAQPAPQGMSDAMRAFFGNVTLAYAYVTTDEDKACLQIAGMMLLPGTEDAMKEHTLIARSVRSTWKEIGTMVAPRRKSQAGLPAN